MVLVLVIGKDQAALITGLQVKSSRKGCVMVQTDRSEGVCICEQMVLTFREKS